MTKPIHAMPLCAPALLLAAQIFTAGFEARAADFTVNSATTVTNGATGRMLNSNDNLTVNPAGSITTSADQTDGINTELSATNNRIINNGNITTSGEISRGIDVNDETEITNNGSITTQGNLADGIDVGDSNTITNNGSITTQTGNGITVSDDNTITNTGDITAANPQRGAIFLSGTDPSDNTLSNTGQIITTTGRGIFGNRFSFLATLTNRVGTKANSGRIQGSTDGINVGFIGSLTNGPGAIIQGTSGDGVKLTRVPSPSTGTGKASVTNSGTIQGAAFGLDYGPNTIETLTNNNSGRIQGGSEAALAATAIDRLTNESGGRIVSTSNDGIRTTGATDRLTNSGEISGGRHGISAASVDRLTNTNTGVIKGGTNGDGINSTGAITHLENSGEISGGRHGISAASSVDRLTNKNTGVIKGTSGDGINSTGAITRLENSGGEISGGRHGISAASVGLTNSGDITGGTSAAGTGDKAGVNLGAGDSAIANTGKITSARGRGISGLATSNITTLSNTVNPGVVGSGLIRGSTDGIMVGRIDNLTNNAGALIEGLGGAGIALSGASGNARATNSGTIKGTTFGMNYGDITLTLLRNTSTGRIEGGNEAALAAAAITRLDNESGGRISSTNNDGIRSAGAIGELNNSGEITGGRHGISAASVGLTNSGDITGGTSAAGTGDKAGVNLGAGDSAIANTGKITSARGRGISGMDTSNITTLSNTVNPGVAGSGLIRGSTDGIMVGRIGSLTNNAVAVIEGQGGAGITLSGAGNARATNRGTIKGTTFGMNYGNITLTQLTNSGLIEGESQAALAAAAITRLDNNADGRIVSTSGDGIRSAGAIGTLNNSGEITGGQDGIEAGSIGSLTNNNLIQAGTGAGVSSNGDITRLDNNARGRIVSTSGDGIRSTGAIGTLNNSGEISGGQDGIEAGSIGRLTNNNLIQAGTGAGVSSNGDITRLDNESGGRIVSTSGDGIRGTGAIGELNNSGEITGGQDGIEAGSIGRLTNNNLIQAGTGAGVSSNGDITRLDNESGGRIVSTSGDGIRGTGAIGELNNSGEITGGRHGISAASVGLTNSGDITGGTSAAGTGDKAGVNLGAGDSAIANTGKITSARGRGISGLATSNITTLSNTVNSGVAGSGLIRGSTDGIEVGRINNLTNNAGAIIEGRSGAGITLNGVSGNGSVTNLGTIRGSTYGMNYGNITLTLLANGGLIQGGRDAAVSAAAITRLDNEAEGRIISTSGDGIHGTGAIGELNNNGEIRGGRDGIRAVSVGTLTNRKTIQGGNGGAGLNVSGEVATLTNHRGAEISGGGDGVRAGSLKALNNDGRIISASGGGVTLTGRSAQAATVVNNGTIQGATHGMDYGENTIASLTNTSAESIRGGTGDGLRAHALRRLNNSGTIISALAGGVTLTGRDASGAEYTNSGRIEGRTHGLDYGDNAIARLDNTATGILRSGEGAAVKGGSLKRLTNRGRIEGKTGIEIRRASGASGGATIENYGLLRGTGGTALGLFGPGRDNLRLYEGSRLEGLVRWDGLGDTFFYAPREPGIYSFRDSDAGPNSEPTRFSIEAPAQQTILRSTVRSPVRGEARTTVAFVDSSLYALAGNTLSRWTGSVAEALAQQTRSEGPGGEGREFWLRPFAGYQRFGREGLRPSARHDYLGGVAGFSLSRGMARIGFFGGGATAEVEVSGVGRDQESSSFFAGAYAHGPVRGLHLHGAVLVGQSRFESVWGQVNSLAAGGRERVGVDYDSLFLSPQIGLLAGGFDLLGLTVRPAVQLRYLARFTDDHAYEPVGGGSALLRIKAHDVHMGLLRAELRALGRLWKGEHGSLHGEMRLGAEGGMVFAGREIPVRLGGGDTAFKAGRGHSAMGFIGAGLRYSMPRLNLTLSADVEGSYDSDSATSVWGQVGFEWEF